MRITNNYNLPQPIMNLFGKEKYTKGDANVSVTELISSPRISLLKTVHKDNIVEDIVDRFWALMGTNVHRILEQGSDSQHLTEERLYAEIDGWTVSGGIDLQCISYDKYEIIDWKFVSVQSIKAPKPDWEAQLNAYAWLVGSVKGIVVDRLQICAILRDWTKSRSVVDDSYPKAPIAMIDIPLWDYDVTHKWLSERVRIHKETRRAHDWGEPVPECTPEEMWVRGSKFVVKKPGAQRASRSFETREEAEEYVASQGVKKTPKAALEIEERPGSRVRCEGNYCGVSAFCSQYAAYKAEIAGE